MTIQLGVNRYGKSAVKLLKIVKNKDRHEIIDLIVEVRLEGDMNDAYTKADNRKVVPTDTMKNTVYIMAKRHDFRTIEDFATILANHFITTYNQIFQATIEINSQPWKHIDTDQGQAPFGFVKDGAYIDTCRVYIDSDGITKLQSGIDKLTVLKSTRSGFENFFQDEYTTLKETPDRVLATTITATWEQADFHTERDNRGEVRRLLLDRFAVHDSKSVQHTLYDMGEAVLSHLSDITRITLSMPNEHKILADLAKFNLENDNEIFVPTDDPSGVIEAEVIRT